MTESERNTDQTVEKTGVADKTEETVDLAGQSFTVITEGLPEGITRQLTTSINYGWPGKLALSI